MDTLKFPGWTTTPRDSECSYKSTIRICSDNVGGWRCHQHGVAVSVCAPDEGWKNLQYSLTLKCPIWHLFYGHFTHALSDVDKSFISGGKSRGYSLWKVCSAGASSLTLVLGFVFAADSSRSFSKTESNKRKLMKRSLPWTFWCSMRWQSHMKKRKMPGWRWCFSILNMMERQSEPRIWHRQRKSNLLKVAVLNKCQSENAASLFKSIRGLGLTVSGGRSPLLWGWGDFFFFLPKFFQS